VARGSGVVGHRVETVLVVRTRAWPAGGQPRPVGEETQG
jgi:hypothetical protein